MQSTSPLYDLMAYAVNMRPAESTTPGLDRIFLRETEVFVTTNVTEYFFAGTDQEYWSIERHFPNLAPLYDSFWVETKRPTHIRSEKFNEQPWDLDNTHLYKRPLRWAAWFLNVNSESVQEFYGTGPIGEYEGVDASKCWCYNVQLYVQNTEDDGRRIHPFWRMQMFIDKETGQPIRNAKNAPQFDPFFFNSHADGPNREMMKAAQRELGFEPLTTLKDPFGGPDCPSTVRDMFEHEAVLLLKPLLLAISFAHCRNVERVTAQPGPKINKARRARNLPPFHRHHTLHIGVMQKIIAQAQAEYRGNKKTDIEMALHRVKGHFKTYTPAKPLMGHAVGTWFWHGQARGSEKRGTVKKTYVVDAPHAK